jgi:hypothetical protein
MELGGKEIFRNDSDKSKLQPRRRKEQIKFRELFLAFSSESLGLPFHVCKCKD